MHGEPALPADFTHFPHVNAQAPKGGRINYAVVGTFDSVNPFIVQGSAARGLTDLAFGYNVYEPLMQRSASEPFTLYPLLAKSVDTDAARTYVEFTLDERAKFSDGKPVTPEDVIFTFELLRDHGLPRYGRSVKKIAKIEKTGERGVRCSFADGADRELPLILGLMPVLPKHAIDPATFEKSSLTAFPGSGPYTVGDVKAGESLTLRRNPDYWGKDLPSKAGVDNYDEIRITWYGNENSLFEGFKKGLVDVFIENDLGRWASGYDFPAVTNGDAAKDTFDNGLPSGMYGFVFNTRRPMFADRAVRSGLGDLIDFEWINRSLFASAYKRTGSYFDGSELSAAGRPASDAEQALLAPFPQAVAPEVLDGSWTPAKSDGTGRDRAFLKRGFDKLKSAGYRVENEKLVGPDGKPLAFDILLRGKDGEQVATAWKRTLALLGIEATLTTVDAAQYTQRLQTYDFDVIAFNYSSSLSPGAEQVGRWGSAFRDTPGTFNYAGVADPAIDAMIDKMLAATSRDDFVTAVRAFDRVLLSGAYAAPLYHQGEQWVGRWTRIGRPEGTPLNGYQLTTWWRAKP
ncbi:MAG: ABC transporter substrate-binding protein [Phyllobacteriaceae bacterium]|nr:ABC transporter substrate-binding protein [Phyllobacteriaceae bacterium]